MRKWKGEGGEGMKRGKGGGRERVKRRGGGRSEEGREQEGVERWRRRGEVKWEDKGGSED